jgi:small subunit ribosomal protein S20
MANIKSQIKRNRQALAARERNKAVRSKLKTVTKRFRTAVADGDRDQATVLYRAAVREYDKAASKGVIHINNAANKKAGMAKQLRSL